MNEDWWKNGIIFLSGMIVGVVLLGMGSKTASNSIDEARHTTTSQTIEMVRDCEKTLPRNQECHLVAVPNEPK